MSPVGITRQYPNPDDCNRTSSEILGYEMASLSPPSWNGEFRLQANPQISASGLVGYVAPANITRQFQITALIRNLMDLNPCMVLVGPR